MGATESMAATACVMTGAERAAIAIINLRGDGATEMIAQNFTPAASRPIRRGDVRYGTWHGSLANDDRPHPGESVVVTFLNEIGDSENVSVSNLDSTMRVDAWEIHCHGGEAAIQRILDDLHSTGAMIINSKDLLVRNGTSELIREAIESLSRTTTIRTAAIALDQVRGAMENFVSDAMAMLQSGEGTTIESIHAQARSILALSDLGKHLVEPWNVVLAGAPNVGKSSLINALVGYQRSITLDRPGTTRDVLQANAVIDGWPILLSDTAGIRNDPSGPIEQQGIERARVTLRTADLVLWVHDAAGDGTTERPVELPNRSIHVMNKIDLATQNPPRSRQRVEIETSATLGTGMDSLRRAIIAMLIPDVPRAGSPVPICDRQIRALNDILAANDVTSLGQSAKQLLGR